MLRRCAKNVQRHERHVKKNNANIEFKCYLVPVCVRLEVTTLFIGQKKPVTNRQNSVNIAALLSCNIQVCGFFGSRTFLFVTFWLRNQHGLHESFSETFTKLSSNFLMTLFSMHFLSKKIMFSSCFFSNNREISPWILSKKWFSLEFS